MDFTFIFFYLQKPFIHVGDTRFRSAADSKKAAGVRAVLLNSLRWTTERKESGSISPHGRRLNTTVHSLQRLKTQSVLNQLWLTQKYIILSETGWEFIHLVFPGLLFAANWWWHLSIKKVNVHTWPQTTQFACLSKLKGIFYELSEMCELKVLQQIYDEDVAM